MFQRRKTLDCKCSRCGVEYEILHRVLDDQPICSECIREIDADFDFCMSSGKPAAHQTDPAGQENQVAR